MPRKKVDERIRALIENGVRTKTRSFLVIVGDRGKDQVVNLHYILSKTQVKARPSVLWCYNKELGFSTCVQWAAVAPPGYLLLCSRSQQGSRPLITTHEHEGRAHTRRGNGGAPFPPTPTALPSALQK